ncbi:MAG: type II toxin-antitoxin system VapC family toxin [Desulfohalobiaceae bacterium]
MILLDTNVVSEVMRAAPEPRIVHWLDSLPETEVWVSAVTVAEIRIGIALLPDSKRRENLFELAEQMFAEDLSGQCLPFDCTAAKAYGQIVSERRKNGRPITVEDAQIAAIAYTGQLTLATRNVRDFSDIHGLQVLNPWTC